ncbi:Mur ligase [Alphaproteobacteria bacterium]|nr:Mur ligase [Alphaproteobacteria bacterium]
MLWASFLIFAARRLLFMLKFLQQNSYGNLAFLRFAAGGARLIDKRLTLCLLAATLGLPGQTWLPPALFLAFAAIERNPLRADANKKKLALTWRARRIFAVALMLAAGALWRLGPLWAVQALPLALVAANLLLWPVEKLGQARYLRAARKRLAEVAPAVIGITGSFGKTSTKNILAHILASSVPAYATERSVNTLMGLTRAIRENLRPHHRYFIAEIGTSHPGEIARICRLVEPRHGILTAIGAAHYGNFNGLDDIAAEKNALTSAVLAASGTMVVNATQVAEKYRREGTVELKDGDITEVEITPRGISFRLSGTPVSAPVYGRHQATNIALAWLLARALGVPEANIRAALATLPQTEHRLEVKNGEIAGTTVIDDGFNSNIDGFVSALETLDILGRARGGRRILVSPGMVELGPLHDDHHRRAAEAANRTADIVVSVAPERIRAFTAALNGPETVEVPTFKAARAWLADHARPADTILYENDLPDVYEEKIRI